MAELKYMPYTKGQREEAAAWLVEHDGELYAASRPMAEAAAKFSDRIGYRVSAHFIGRIAAKLRREGQVRYAGRLPIVLKLEWRGHDGATWARLIGACRWLLREEGSDLSDLYLARRILEGVSDPRGGLRFSRVRGVTIEAVQMARRAIRGDT